MDEKQGKIAFLGVGNIPARREVEAIEAAAAAVPGFAFKVMGSGAFSDLREAAAAVTTVTGREVNGTGGLLYVSKNEPEAIRVAAARLQRVGVNVQLDWIDFDPDFIEDMEAITGWLARNEWPEFDPLAALLFSDDDAAATVSTPQTEPDPLDGVLGLEEPAATIPAATETAPATDPQTAPDAQAPAPATQESAPTPAQAAPKPAPAPELDLRASAPRVAEAAAQDHLAPAVTFQLPTPAPVSDTGNVEPQVSFPAVPKELAVPKLDSASGFRLPPATAVSDAATPKPNPLLPGSPLPPPTNVGGSESDFLAAGPESHLASGPSQAPSPSTVAAAAAQRAQNRASAADQGSATPAKTWNVSGWEDAPDQSDGKAIFFTGTHGGSGKTTMAFLSAHTLAESFKRAGRANPVYLLEADAGNSKLENRLQLRAEKTSLAYVQYLDWLDENKGVADEAYIRQVEQEAIERATFVDLKTGLRIIAAPFDTRKSTPAKIQRAIVLLAKSLLASGAYVCIDSGTAGRKDDKAIDRDLADLADHIFIATSAGERNDQGVWVDGHLADMQRMVTTFTSSTEAGGWGLDKNKVTTFFNQTTADSYYERCNDTPGVTVSGYLPFQTAFKDGWIGDYHGHPAFLTAVIYAGKALSKMTGLQELAVFNDRTPPGETAHTASAPEKRKRRFMRARSTANG